MFCFVVLCQSLHRYFTVRNAVSKWLRNTARRVITSSTVTNFPVGQPFFVCLLQTFRFSLKKRYRSTKCTVVTTMKNFVFRWLVTTTAARMQPYPKEPPLLSATSPQGPSMHHPFEFLQRSETNSSSKSKPTKFCVFVFLVAMCTLLHRKWAARRLYWAIGHHGPFHGSKWSFVDTPERHQSKLPSPDTEFCYDFDSEDFCVVFLQMVRSPQRRQQINQMPRNPRPKRTRSRDVTHLNGPMHHLVRNWRFWPHTWQISVRKFSGFTVLWLVPSHPAYVAWQFAVDGNTNSGVFFSHRIEIN